MEWGVVLILSQSVFDGRIIFDHLPKAAGTAVNAWLVKVLGSGCVTPNLIGKHQDLICRYGGEYSVISGHVNFEDFCLERIEEIFGWAKTVGSLRKNCFIGLAKVKAQTTFTLAAYNLTRMATIFGWRLNTV